MTTGRDDDTDLPTGLAAPARRARSAAGYTRLEQLGGASRSEIAGLHGIGAKALDPLGS